MREHLETFLAHARGTYGAPLPRYVEDELRGYLRCGVFSHGFVRAHCDACDHELLVAFSCKLRGVCPNCAARRMANTAAHLVDRVLPRVPVRQWVLSLPFELRALAASDAGALKALARTFASAVERRYCAWAVRAGVVGDEGPRTGAVTFVQRFGSSLNLHVHFHVCLLDGVYVRDGAGRLSFHDAPPPERAELEAVARAVYRRALRWLQRHGHLDATPLEGRSNEPASLSPLSACIAVASGLGTVRAVSTGSRAAPGSLRTSDDASGAQAPARDGDAVEHGGFNLHAGVRLDAEDDRGRERLCRYGVCRGHRSSSSWLWLSSRLWWSMRAALPATSSAISSASATTSRSLHVSPTGLRSIRQP